MATQRLPSIERRRQIAEAALRILANDGPRALTLVRLGEAVGIADASVLRHFRDKDEIIEAAIDRFGEYLAEDIPENIADPIERLHVFFVRRAAKIRSHPEVLALAHNTRLRDVADGDGVSRIDRNVARTVAFIGCAIEDGVASGQIRGDVPTAMWSWIVVGVLRGSTGHVPAPLLEGATADIRTPEGAWAVLRTLMST